MIRWVVELMGTASPTPTPATAVLTPTIRPRLSASTPPLLPGLSAASVWITSSTTRPSPVGSDRPRPDTMPAVTLPASPSGLPRATTSWPTCSCEALPSSTGGGTSAARPEHGEIGERVAADHVGGDLGAVGEGGGGLGGALDHVGAGEQIAVGGQHAGAAGALAPAAADPEAGHAGQHPLGDADHRGGVGVEDLPVPVIDHVGLTPAAAICSRAALSGFSVH